MSLEQALNEATAVMKQLITVLSSGATLAPATEEAGESTEGTKRKRRTKAEMEADAAAQQQVTRYWHIAANSTVYEQKPGDPDCTLPGAVQVPQAEYEALKAKYAAVVNAGNAATATPAATPAPSTPAASTASAPTSSEAPTIQSVTAKLMALHKRDGNAPVAKVLAQFGAGRVPDLASKNLVDVDAAVEALLNPQSNDNLFG